MCLCVSYIYFSPPPPQTPLPNPPPLVQLGEPLVDEEEDVTPPDGFWWWCLPLLMQHRALTLCLCQLWCVTAEWVTGQSLGESGGVWGESDVSLTLSRCASLQHKHSHKEQARMAWLYMRTSSFSRAVKYYWAGVQLRRTSESIVSFTLLTPQAMTSWGGVSSNCEWEPTRPSRATSLHYVALRSCVSMTCFH